MRREGEVEVSTAPGRVPMTTTLLIEVQEFREWI